MSARIAINGFGRIGRSVFRVAAERDGVEVVAINDVAPLEVLAHLLEYDSVMGRFQRPVQTSTHTLTVDGREVRAFREPEPLRLPWAELAVDAVLECTGRHTVRADAKKHLRAGARRVLLSAPGGDPDLTVVLGVNHDLFDPDRHYVVSNSSCTANCLAPILKVLHDSFGVARGVVTTIHSYTNEQYLLDHPHSDLRRARAAALSMVPTTTGAAHAVGLVLPSLRGRLDGVSVRVPTPGVSLVDLTAVLDRRVGVADVNGVLRAAAEGELRGILDYSDAPLVSADYVGSPRSATVDGLSTRVSGGDLLKILAWYDNEWGYANRLVDLVEVIDRRETRPLKPRPDA